jgi:hypothetical protein
VRPTEIVASARPVESGLLSRLLTEKVAEQGIESKLANA